MKKLISILLLTLLPGLAMATEQPASAPLFAATLSDLDDKPVALANYRGKPLVVNFWARWCAPCRAEIPELNAFRDSQKGKIEVLGIGIEDKAEPAKAFAKTYAITYPVFVAKEKGIPLMQALGNTKGGLPFTLFIDRNGNIVHTKLGLLKKADLDAAGDMLLKR